MITRKLDEFLLILEINTSIMLSNRKFMAMLLFFIVINIVPGALVFAISTINDIHSTAKSLYEILANWQITLTSNILSIILPLYASNISLGEQIRKKTLFNIVARPIKREIISISFVASATLLLTLIGFLIGSIQYVTLYIATRLRGNIITIPVEIVYQTGILFLLVTPIYFTLADILLLTTKDLGVKTMIIYFFITLLLDLILSALAGNYVYLSLSHYRNSILYQLALDPTYGYYISSSIQGQPSPVINTILALFIPSTILILLHMWTFSRADL